MHEQYYKCLGLQIIVSRLIVFRIKIMTTRKEADLSKVEFTTSDGVDVLPTFDSMGLREDLLRGIYAYGKWFDFYV